MPTLAATRALQRLLAAARRLEPTLRKQVETAILALQAGIAPERLERILRTRDTWGVYDLAGSLPTQLRGSLAVVEAALAAGLQAGEAQLGVILRLNALDPYAALAARTLTASLVTGVTGETRSAIRTIIGRAFSQGIPVREAAVLIRPLIGVTARQGTAVLKQYQVDIADGMSRTTATQRAKKRAARMVRDRATLIARTEIIRAETLGQQAAWKAARAKGLISARSEQVWIVTEDDRLCPLCAELDGETAPLDGTFEDGVSGPPLHPNCRCTIALRPVGGQQRRAA